MTNIWRSSSDMVCCVCVEILVYHLDIYFILNAMCKRNKREIRVNRSLMKVAAVMSKLQDTLYTSLTASSFRECSRLLLSRSLSKSHLSVALCYTPCSKAPTLASLEINKTYLKTLLGLL